MGKIKTRSEEARRSKAYLAVCITYIIFCIGSAIYWTVELQVRNLLMSVLFILFVPCIRLVERMVGFRCGAVFTASVLFIAMGSILGSCFNVYTFIPFFDTLLHGMSGVIFAALGFALARRLFAIPDEGDRGFFGCLVFAMCFSLAVAVLWELFEYGCTLLFGFDMMEDAYVGSISSYLLSGTHNEVVTIDGITKTVIYYGDGATFTVNGYLDLGLIDTITDLAICTAGTLIFAALAAFSQKKFPALNRALIPGRDNNR